MTVTVLVTDQVKDTEPEKPEGSVAVTVGEYDPPVVGEPLTTPVEATMASPGGRPVADHVKLETDGCESVAVIVSDTGAPDVDDCDAGRVTVTRLLITHVNCWVSLNPPESVAVRSTE